MKKGDYLRLLGSLSLCAEIYIKFDPVYEEDVCKLMFKGRGKWDMLDLDVLWTTHNNLDLLCQVLCGQNGQIGLLK